MNDAQRSCSHQGWRGEGKSSGVETTGDSAMRLRQRDGRIRNRVGIRTLSSSSCKTMGWPWFR